MKHSFIVSIILSIALVLLFPSCSEKDKDAQSYLDNAKELFQNGNLEAAQQKLDSIGTYYPKAIKQRKEAWTLLQDVRKGINDKTIKECDSLLSVYQLQLEDLKKQFTLVQNKKYQDKGTYIPKNDPAFAGFSTNLRSGVIEDGNMYIESTYIGGQQHNSLKLSTEDNKSVETQPETGDGLNYRFNGIETIRFTKITENGIFDFIIENQNQAITVTLQGGNTNKYLLSNQSKKSIILSYELSKLMKQIEETQKAKYKAITLNDYLKETKDSPIPVNEN